MKMSKEDLVKKVNDKVMDEDVKIELMEDITDSFEENATNEDAQRITELEEKYKILQEKYKERFLKGEEKKEDKEKEDNDEELEEKEVIDVKEI